MGGKTYTYTYNDSGIRTSKTVDGVTSLLNGEITISNYNKTWTEIAANVVIDGAISYGLGKIPGINGATAGRNSWSAVYRSGLTKLRNGTVARMSVRVIVKGLASSIIGGFALDGYYGVKQHAYDRIKIFLP